MSPPRPTHGASAGDVAVVPGHAPTEGAAKKAKRPVPCLALSPDEAAEAISVSRDFFDEHVKKNLRVVRCGTRLLVPTRELERWLAESASRPLAEEL